MPLIKSRNTVDRRQLVDEDIDLRSLENKSDHAARAAEHSDLDRSGLALLRAHRNCWHIMIIDS
jgi:hypothetical protein